jgi:hypothetical protein
VYISQYLNNSIVEGDTDFILLDVTTEKTYKKIKTTNCYVCDETLSHGSIEEMRLDDQHSIAVHVICRRL